MHLDLQFIVSLNCLKRWCWVYNSKGFQIGLNKVFVMPEGEERKYFS